MDGMDVLAIVYCCATLILTIVSIFVTIYINKK